MEVSDPGTQAAEKVVHYLANYQPPRFFIDAVDLQLDLDPSRTSVTCKLSIRRNLVDFSDRHALRLDGRQLTLVSISLDGVVLAPDHYDVDTHGLSIETVSDEFVLETTVELNPAQNASLEGLYFAGGKFCTQCEAEGFRRITYFMDRPDVLSRYRVRLIADKKLYPVLLSNGNRIGAGDLSGDRHFAVWEDPSLKPCYLFATVAGNLACFGDTFITRSGNTVNLGIYTENDNLSKCAHAMASLKQAMRWDEELYGREYDLDNYMIVAVNDFNSGAMENKGLNIFNSSFVLANPETATDEDYANIQTVIGHEYFHNWSGNRVTCRDWFQLCLKEGFTVFRDQQFTADMNSEVVKRIHDVNLLRNIQFAEDAGPIAHAVRPDHYAEINNFYTTTVYNKGAEVFRMLLVLVGSTGFRAGTDLYFERNDGKAATADEFLYAMEDANGIDLAQFRLWLTQAGTPALTITDSFDPITRRYTLNVQQACASTPNQQQKHPLRIPIAFGLLDPRTGLDLAVSLENDAVEGDAVSVLQLTEAEHTFVFEGLDEKPVASLLRGFSAPVKVTFCRSEEDLAFLVAHDSDAFNRWDAAQSLALLEINRQIERYQAGLAFTTPEHLTTAFHQVLRNTKIDHALLAQLLMLPSETYLADQLPVIDVDAVFHARQFVRKHLGSVFYDELMTIHQVCIDNTHYQFTSEASGKRLLKNMALDYLMETQRTDVIDLCVGQVHQASNMTDRLAALTSLSHYDIPQRVECLDEFYAQYSEDPLVLDKWFSIQSRSRLVSSYDTVCELLKHPAFNIKNPNNVRAVLAGFCVYNPVNFHRADGKGYELLAEQVFKLDAFNPLIASRLAKFLSRWQRFDTARCQRMQDVLISIQNVKSVSTQVREIVDMCLDS